MGFFDTWPDPLPPEEWELVPRIETLHVHEDAGLRLPCSVRWCEQWCAALAASQVQVHIDGLGLAWLTLCPVHASAFTAYREQRIAQDEEIAREGDPTFNLEDYLPEMERFVTTDAQGFEVVFSRPAGSHDTPPELALAPGASWNKLPEPILPPHVYDWTPPSDLVARGSLEMTGPGRQHNEEYASLSPWATRFYEYTPSSFTPLDAPMRELCAVRKPPITLEPPATITWAADVPSGTALTLTPADGTWGELTGKNEIVTPGYAHSETLSWRLDTPAWPPNSVAISGPGTEHVKAELVHDDERYLHVRLTVDGSAIAKAIHTTQLSMQRYDGKGGYHHIADIPASIEQEIGEARRRKGFDEEEDADDEEDMTPDIPGDEAYPRVLGYYDEAGLYHPSLVSAASQEATRGFQLAVPHDPLCCPACAAAQAVNEERVAASASGAWHSGNEQSWERPRSGDLARMHETLAKAEETITQFITALTTEIDAPQEKPGWLPGD